MTDIVDVREMLVVHTALLRETRLAPDLVRRVPAGDPQRTRTVADHLDLVLDLVEGHHSSEDRTLWPLLRTRLPGPAAAVVDDMAVQHADIEVAMVDVRAALATWRTGAVPATPLADALRVLRTRLATHLDDEESRALPLASTCLTREEWDAVGDAGRESVPKPKLPLVFGMMMYEGDPAVTASMLAGAPLPVRVLVPRIAPGIHARYARRVHGTAAP